MSTWKGLKKQIESLFDEQIDLQIHATSYVVEGKSNLFFPRHWVALRKKIIWDFPRDFISSRHPGKPNSIECVDTDAGLIADLIREYVNSSIQDLLKKEFVSDKYGLTNILKAGDRRLGKEKLLNWSNEMDVKSPVKLVIKSRFGSNI